MDRLQFNSFHLDGWITNTEQGFEINGVFNVNITFVVLQGNPNTATGRVRIIPDRQQGNGLVNRTFQGSILDFHMQTNRPVVREIGLPGGIYRNWGLDEVTVNLIITDVIYEGDDGYRGDFVISNYPQLPREDSPVAVELPTAEDLNAFRELLQTGLVGSYWGSDFYVANHDGYALPRNYPPVENKFEPECSNRLKQIDDFDIIPSTGEKMNKYTLFDYLELEQVGSVISETKEPGHDDITDLIEVAQKMPRTPEEIEDFAAPFIATIALNALYHCNELRARATVYAGNKKVDLDAVYGALIEGSDKAATVTKEISKSKPGYIRAAKEFEKAKAYVEFYNGLSSNFEKCHYWAKSREVANQQEFKGSAYEPHHDSDSGKGEAEVQHREVRAATEVGHRNSLREAKPVEDVNF